MTLGAPPVLSTPDTHILNETGPPVVPTANPVSDQELFTRYEIQRTLDEIRSHQWHNVALQFPDHMLPDSARIFQLLARGLQDKPPGKRKLDVEQQAKTSTAHDELTEQISVLDINNDESRVKLTILADTSYGSCCVDEIAAEHVEADAVVHYGRACLSPTARLPVIHIFTHQSLDREKVSDSFRNAFPDRSMKILLTADMAYSQHVEAIHQELVEDGYKGIFAAEIIHDPSSPVPNRTLPEEVRGNPDRLKQWRLFHISQPPTSLLLTLSSRLSEVHIYPTDNENQYKSATASIMANTSLILRRRYALVTSLTTVPIWGILINTLSVKNYLHIVDHVKAQIARAGKKSYMFVVGKLNAAKVANFSEVGGWVVIGCWESSLVDSKDFYKPVVTPFELELALKRDEDRLWTGDWSANFQSILDGKKSDQSYTIATNGTEGPENVDGDYDTEEESAPPEFDLRTGRYISQTRPMQASLRGGIDSINGNGTPQSMALAKRANGDVAAVNAVSSPAAQFLQSKRTWKGLGSDFEIGYEDEEAQGGTIREGRSGIARGYVVGEQSFRT